MQRRNLLLAGLGSVVGSAARAADLLDTPAQKTALADQRLITGIARVGPAGQVGAALVAVGQRGHIVRSLDGGRSWQQVPAPVSVDLTAVRFVDARIGYATGHDGVVLGSRDGGLSWTRLLDGRQVNALVLEQMQHRAAAADASEQDRKLLEEAKRNSQAGPDKPFLDLHFSDADHGFVAGAYGLVMRTADGGRNWESWFDRVDNPGLLNIYALRAGSDGLYAAGESGLLLKLDRDGQQGFRALNSPYKGSYFGLSETSAGMLAFGMRGHASLSSDAGASWQAVETGLPASIVAGDIHVDSAGAAVLALVDQGGNLALSRDGGRNFTQVAAEPPMPVAAAAFVGKASLLLGGPRGLRAVELALKDK
jgi:photosystem II stability/assembly factor-like uncharacterized protein